MSFASKSGDDSSSSVVATPTTPSEDEHYSSRTSFHSLDESYYQNKPVDAATSGKLLFWPPVQAYKVLEDNGIFEFRCIDGVGIYSANMECRRALETSAFMEFMQSIGITPYLKSKTAEAQILIYIKPTICEVPESFELQVRPHKIILIAADYTGVLYALTALKDLLTLVAETSYEDESKVMRLPSLLLSDAPRLQTRAVQWSYQFHVFASPKHPASAVRFLSSLKFNTIFLHLDQVFELYDEPFESALAAVEHDLLLLHDLAMSHGIQVVPTVVLNHVERPQTEVIARLLRLSVWSRALCIFDYSLALSVHRSKETLRISGLETLKLLQTLPLESILVAVNPNIAAAMALDNLPEEFKQLSMTIIDYDCFHAEPLRRKPIVLLREQIDSMVHFVDAQLTAITTNNNNNNNSNATSTTTTSTASSSETLLLALPLQYDKDFLAPEILQRYLLALFSACVSFGPKMHECFLTPTRYAETSKPLARLLQLTHSSVLTQNTSSSSNNKSNSINNTTSTLVGGLTRTKLAIQAQQDVLLELFNYKSGAYSGHTQAAVEQALWSLSLMADDVQPSDLPRADEALALYRCYRELLQSARYKSQHQSMQQRRALRLYRSAGSGLANNSSSSSVADITPRKRSALATASAGSASSSYADFSTCASPITTTNVVDNNNVLAISPQTMNLQTTTTAPANNASNHHGSLLANTVEVDVTNYFAVIESLCMLSRAVYLAASLATAAASDAGNDTASAAVLAELLPNSAQALSNLNSNLNGNLNNANANNTGNMLNNNSNNNNNNNNNLNNMNMSNNDATMLSSANVKRAAVYDNVDMSKPYAPKVIPKTPVISQLLTRVVQQNILFRNFKSEEHASIVEAFECVTTKAGEIVIKQGDSGEYFYIIEQGKMDVFMESCGLRIKVGRSLAMGDYFGELALMYNTPRAATVVSTEASTLWRIDRTTYRSIVTHHNKVTSDEYFQLVSNVSILGKRLGDVLSSAELTKVVSTLEIEEFEPGAVIIRQHATGDYFYIISEGQVDVFQESTSSATNDPSDNNSNSNSNSSGNSNNNNNHVLGACVATLSRGDCFGEKSLLADDVRQASCVAINRVVCLSLSRDDFIAMIGSWQDVTAAQDVQRLALAAKRAKIRASVYDSQYHLTINLDELERLNTLGEGAFGRVLVARHKNSGQLYALKCQAKTFICAQNMQEMVLNEVAIMKQLDHPLITKLHAVMQDKRYIYFLLELLPGGEFFSFLQTTGKLSEDKARFYAASVVLALEELHKAKVAYRDLKPENMVMDSRGYVKLVDFGLAKQVLSGSTWTMCGTPDYLAPEIILNKGHNHAVDYWALGVLVYEMIHGWPPFYHDSPMKVYEKIIMGKVDYPTNFSKALEDIVSKFIVKNPSKRLGNIKGGIADITKHKWFGSFDWRGLMAGTLLAPVMPNLSSFDAAVAAGAEEEEEENDRQQHEESEWMPDLF